MCAPVKLKVVVVGVALPLLTMGFKRLPNEWLWLWLLLLLGWTFIKLYVVADELAEVDPNACCSCIFVNEPPLLFILLLLLLLPPVAMMIVGRPEPIWEILEGVV